MIETFVDGMEEVIIEKKEFNYRDVSKLAFCAVLTLSGFRRKDQNRFYLYRLAFLKWRAVG